VALQGVYPLLAAGGPVTFVATKVTKKASAERLLCAHSLYPANRAEPRAAIICPTSFTQSLCFCKTCYALAAAPGHHCSARFHPKLICWRGKKKRASFQWLAGGMGSNPLSAKAGERVVQRSVDRVSWLCDMRIFLY